MEEGFLLNEGKKNGGEATGRRGGEYKEEGCRLGEVALPMVAVTLSQYLLQEVPIMMVGHLGEISLASASIASSLTSVTGFTLLLGLSSGLETLCGQAYGAQQYQKLGIHLYGAIFFLILVCLPISCIWISMGRLLAFIGQEPLISLEAGKFTLWAIPGLFAYAIAQPLMQFLQSQSLIRPMLLSSIVTLCVHIPLSWILVFKCELGIVGAALSISISNWLCTFILGSYILCSACCEPTRIPFSREAFSGINEFLRIALPSAVMICLEYWSFELLILMSGLLPNPAFETSVLSICFNTIFLINSIPYGLGAAASTRVSNELGGGNSEGARLVVRVVMFITLTEAVIMGVALFSSRYILGHAYSNEKKVIDYVKRMVPLICLSVLMDNLQAVLSGIARGCGWQHLGAYVNLGAFYLVGIPTAVLLGFGLQMRGVGLWIGILVGTMVQTILLSLITIFTNWQHQVNKAREQIPTESSSAESVK